MSSQSSDGTGVVHVICASLQANADAAAVDHAVELAHAMREADGARAVVVGRSASALATAAWLDDRDALEPFAASPAHMAFIMRGLAPCISGMWSAAIECDATLPGEVAALWVFALHDSEALYEWQVRDLLGAVEALPGLAAAGPTIEERERYRAGGVVCIPPGAEARFRAALDDARPGWGEVAAGLTHELLTAEPVGVRGDGT